MGLLKAYGLNGASSIYDPSSYPLFCLYPKSLEPDDLIQVYFARDLLLGRGHHARMAGGYFPTELHQILVWRESFLTWYAIYKDKLEPVYEDNLLKKLRLEGKIVSRYPLLNISDADGYPAVRKILLMIEALRNVPISMVMGAGGIPEIVEKGLVGSGSYGTKFGSNLVSNFFKTGFIVVADKRVELVNLALSNSRSMFLHPELPVTREYILNNLNPLMHPFMAGSVIDFANSDQIGNFNEIITLSRARGAVTFANAHLTADFSNDKEACVKGMLSLMRKYGLLNLVTADPIVIEYCFRLRDQGLVDFILIPEKTVCKDSFVYGGLPAKDMWLFSMVKMVDEFE